MIKKKNAPNPDEAGLDPIGMAAQAMKAAGLMRTLPRLAVWRIVSQSSHPLGAMEIKRRLVAEELDISMSSIYMALKRLNDAKLLTTCTIDGKLHYHLASRNFRQQVVCEDSGDVYWLADPDFSRAVDALCRKHGFTMSDYTLSVRGRRIAPEDDDDTR